MLQSIKMIGDANREAVSPRTSQVDLMRAVRTAGIPVDEVASWLPAWALLRVGGQNPSTLSGDAVLFSAPVTPDGSIENARRVERHDEVTGRDGPLIEPLWGPGIGGMTHAPPGRMRTRPSRMSVYLAQAAIANRSAASSVVGTGVWVGLSTHGVGARLSDLWGSCQAPLTAVSLGGS